jgi:hypothetical protein
VSAGEHKQDCKALMIAGADKTMPATPFALWKLLLILGVVLDIATAVAFIRWLAI